MDEVIIVDGLPDDPITVDSGVGGNLNLCIEAGAWVTSNYDVDVTVFRFLTLLDPVRLGEGSGSSAECVADFV